MIYLSLKARCFLFISFLILGFLIAVPGIVQADQPRPYVSSTGCDNISEENPPINLGVSGGNLFDENSSYCCTGTLGSLVKDSSGAQYILSNNHVLAKTNKGSIGDYIIQPGLVDLLPSPCRTDLSNNFHEVATLFKFVPLNFSFSSPNSVDAAIAKVIQVNGVPGVNTQGLINCIGQISPLVRTLSKADVGVLAVQKSGRTTGVTSAKVSAINVSLLVTYNQSCGIGTQYALFKNQIRVDGSGFCAGGDSGSLIVTKPATGLPQPVGLLFAGSSTQTFANPIQTVLNAFPGFPLSVVGGTTAAAATPSLTGAVSEEESEEIAHLKDVQARHEKDIMKIPGVLGMGIGRSEEGQLIMEIYVKKHTPELESQLPKTLDGAKVLIVETGEVRAL